MAVIHISEEEAARNLPELLGKVRSGSELLIDDGRGTVRVTRADPFRCALPPLSEPRLISEILADLRANPSTDTLDERFGDDLEAVIREGQDERFDPWEAA